MRPQSDPLKAELEYVDCPMCGSSSSTVWMDDGKPTRYVRCRACGTVYASPRAPRSLRYAWLDENFGVGDRAFVNATNRRPALEMEAGMIQRIIDNGWMLDIGCDLGDFFEWFPDPEWERYGVELSSSAADYAAKTYMAKVFTGTVQEAKYPTSSFDLVTMIDLIYYLDDPVGDLHDIRRILKPDGLLAIEATGQAYQLFRSRGPLCWLLERRWTRLHTDSAYLQWQTPQGLKQLLARSDFQIVDWYVVPSPKQSSIIQRSVSRAHYAAISAIYRRNLSALAYTPKYLCLARPSK